MKKKAWLVILGAIVAAAGVIWLVTPAEPSYNGHTLNYWLDNLSDRADSDLPTERQEIENILAFGTNAFAIFDDREKFDSITNPKAVEAITGIGTNALPILLAHLRGVPARFSRITLSALERVPAACRPRGLLVWALRDQVQSRASSAMGAFFILGPTARSAIPELASMMNNPKSRTVALRAQCALVYIGKDALPHLVRVLEDPSAPNRTWAAICIGDFPDLRTNAAPAVPALVALLKDPDLFAQRSAAEALGNISLQAELVVPALISTAQGAREASVRRACISALGEFGPRARAATNYLLSVKDEFASTLDTDAAKALLQIAPETLKNLPR